MLKVKKEQRYCWCLRKEYHRIISHRIPQSDNGSSLQNVKSAV